MAEQDLDLGDSLVLADLVTRVLDRGVSVMGDVTISVAGIDLVHLGLRLDLAAVETSPARTAGAQLPGGGAGGRLPPAPGDG